jgi:hypothetical protein
MLLIFDVKGKKKKKKFRKECGSIFRRFLYNLLKLTDPYVHLLIHREECSFTKLINRKKITLSIHRLNREVNFETANRNRFMIEHLRPVIGPMFSQDSTRKIYIYTGWLASACGVYGNEKTVLTP